MAKKKSNLSKWIIIIIAVLTAACIYSAIKEPDTFDRDKYQLEKTGAGTSADYTANCQKIHKTVDKIIAANSLNVIEIKDENKKVKRDKVEGLIKWHTRSIFLKIADDIKINELKDAIAKDLQKDKADVLAMEPDVYQSQNVIRIDIGFTDNLDGEKVTIITERIFILNKDKEYVQIADSKPKIKAKLAIIIDDFGYSSDAIDEFCGVERPITFSVLPFRPYSRLSAERAQGVGKEVMLHLPMEPLTGGAQSEKETILVSMNDGDIKDLTLRSLAAVPEAKGVNNHQGSRATGDKRVMQTVLSIIKSRGLFFIDSRTHSSSIAYNTAAQMGIKTNQNNIFIDNKADIEYTKNQLRQAKDIALHNGEAIAIGHARYTTAAAIKEIIPEFEKQGIQFVFASQLAK